MGLVVVPVLPRRMVPAQMEPSSIQQSQGILVSAKMSLIGPLWIVSSFLKIWRKVNIF